MFILYLSHVVSEKKQDVSYGSCGLEDEARLFFKAIYTKTQQKQHDQKTNNQEKTTNKGWLTATWALITTLKKN